MTNERNKTESTTDRESSPASNPGRRQFAKATLAAPVLLSVTTRSAWGTETCTISGLMSGNVSRHGDTDCDGGGCTPGFWKNNYLPWECTGYSPGWLRCSDGTSSIYSCSGGGKHLEIVLDNDPYSPTAWGHRTDTWQTMFGCAPPSGSGYASDTPLLTILQGGSGAMNIQKTFAKHSVAAVLNASCIDVAYGSNAGDLKTAICVVSGGGTFGGRTMEQFADWLDDLNNRGCPLGANETFNPTVTIEGKTYDTMYKEPEYVPVIVN